MDNLIYYVLFGLAVLLIVRKIRSSDGGQKQELSVVEPKAAARPLTREERFEVELQSLMKVDEDGDAVSLALPDLDPAEYRYRRVAGETLHHVVDGVSRIEMKSTGRVAGHGLTFSIPIMKGVRYRVGAGRIAGQKKPQVTDSGRLLITSKAVAFEGSVKNDRLNWTQIADIDFHSDGISVMRRTGPVRVFEFTEEDIRAQAILMLLLGQDN